MGLRLQKTRSRFSFVGRSVMITGGSRDLGLVLARELARKGTRLSIIARDAEELKRAEVDLVGMGAEVLTVACDVRKQEQVNDAVSRVVARFAAWTC
jgi:NAD(P)-dependent dehydrogenase (short-subunit alcohol dehydrogenase family)